MANKKNHSGRVGSLETAAAQEALQRARRRRARAFRSLLVRTVLMIAVIYALFFQIVGVTVMPNGDMYPRIDAGDLLLFYRLDRDVRAQDIVVLQKDAASIQDYNEANVDNDPNQIIPPSTDTEPDAGSEPNVAPTPDPQARTPAQIVADDSFRGKLNRWVYRASTALKLRRPEGSQLFVCRVVAVAGDTVEITESGQLMVNGNAMVESNIFSQTTQYLGFTEYPLKLNEGECFVMADLRNGGADSRFFGPVHRDEILGTVITLVRRNNL